jgi:tRNA pseudouridine55 synthase
MLKIYKPLGLTPLQLINQYKKLYPEYKDKKMAYAGRLDPMAEGLLLVLVGEEECKDRSQYQVLPKQYEFDVIFGVETDSYDLLGKVTNFSSDFNPGFSKKKITETVKQFCGRIEQQYPPYSSFHIKGNPLFWWSRENRLDEITLPTKEIEIYNLNFLEKEQKNINLKQFIFEKIDTVKGDFRQVEIKQIWAEFLEEKKYPVEIYKFRIDCSSGTYVRQLVKDMGDFLGVYAVTARINRTKISLD